MLPLFALWLSSCIPNKDLVLIQNKATKIHPDSLFFKSKKGIYYLQPGDLLSIKVLGPDPIAIAPFNLEAGAASSVQVNNTQLYISGYSINEDGNINFPYVGLIKVAGKTVPQIEELITKELEKYINNPSVKVKLVSFKVTILGEVRNPGLHFIYNDRATIFEALGFSGDITDLGDRHHVRIIRNTNEGTKVIQLDLTDNTLINSNFYFLMPNDVVYVQPLKAKNFRLNIPAVSLALSGLTAILVLMNFIIK